MASSRNLLGLVLLLALGCGGGQQPHDGHGERSHAERSEHGHEEHAHEEHAHQEHAHQEHGEHHHGPGHFADAERYAEVFDAPDRDAWQRPAEVVSLLELQPGQHVADLGAGTGYFLPHISAIVGASGETLGLDIEPNMVRYMRERIEREGLPGARAAQCPLDGPGVPAGSLDRILIVDTWHHLSDRADYSRVLQESLRPGGMVLVVDFTRDAPEGPPPAMRLPPETVMEELRAGGFTDVTLLEETLPRQYVVRARVPE